MKPSRNLYYHHYSFGCDWNNSHPYHLFLRWQLRWPEPLVLDSGCMLKSLGELVKEPKSQASVLGSEIRTWVGGGEVSGSGFCIFFKKLFRGFYLTAGVRSTDKSTSILGRPLNMELRWELRKNVPSGG